MTRYGDQLCCNPMSPLIVFERFSVDTWKRYKNAGVDENILLRFHRDENGCFWKRISVYGALVWKLKADKVSVCFWREATPKPVAITFKQV